MLRLVFNRDDMARVRLASAPDPLWELVLSVHRLRRPCGQDAHGEWIGWARTLDSPSVWAAAHTLGALVPARGYFPDFLTPAGEFTSCDEGIDVVLQTPRRRLRDELSKVPRLPPWGHDIASGTGIAGLGSALRTYHDGLIKPHWEPIGQRLEADRTARIAQLLAGGVERLLSGFGSFMRWREPVLEVDYPVNREVHLNGRGLLLVPSFFCDRTPVSLADDDLPPVLVYPIGLQPGWIHPAEHHRHVEALIGRTRATVLRAAAHGSTTSQIARRLEISAASVSEHVGVLRGSGLLVSHRQGRAVVHCLTRLGSSLLLGRA